jgi:purine-binding chemotaxis protein CheW
MTAESDLVGEPADSDVRQFVTFIVGEEVFAVELAPVQEIVRVPDTVRVPLGPRSLDGLANLRGKVLPIVSLRRILGLGERPRDDATRALVIDLGQPLGFVVDKVVSVVGVEATKIEGVDAIHGTVNVNFLAGVIKDVGGHAMIMVIDFRKLVAEEFSNIVAVARRSAVAAGANQGSQTGGGDGDGGGVGVGDGDGESASDELQLVSFEVAGQEYAISIDDVQEIVQVPPHIMQVPRSDAHVLGVMTLRNRLLPVVSLRRMFALPAHDVDDQSRIVVVGVGGAPVGIVMDSVNQVLRVARSDVDPMPSLLVREGQLSEISEICRLDGGKRLVSIISAASLFRSATIKQALTTLQTALPTSDDRPATDVTTQVDDDEQVVVFRLGKEEFGAPIASVQEIVRVPEQLSHVPRAPPFVEGVINLRGIVLPVIDLRRRLGLPAVERSDRQRVMVFSSNGPSTGFIVDSVAEVLRIPRATIAPTPQLSGDQSKLLARMANLEEQERLVQLIDPAHLVEAREWVDLAAMGS